MWSYFLLDLYVDYKYLEVFVFVLLVGLWKEE